MKKRVLFLLVLAMLMVFTGAVLADKSDEKPDKCTTIPSGELTASDGSVIETGFADNGYNYQAHLFNGNWDGDFLVMKWNDAWLSNKDCNDDSKLDLHYGFDSYIGSGAWCTNHWVGEYEGENGEVCKWTESVKIIAAPADATIVDGNWINAGGVEIGPVLWGSFAIIQDVYNDPCTGDHGVYYLSPDHAGLGGW